MHPRVFSLLSALIMALTVLQIFNLPQPYALQFWLLDYRVAIVRRGLAGHLLYLLAPVGGRVPYQWSIVFVAMAVLLALMLLYHRTLHRTLMNTGGRNSVLAWPLLALASSPFVFYSVHCVGYMDSILAILAICNVGAITGAYRHRSSVTVILSVIGVLFHESYLFFGLPAVLFATYLMDAQPVARATRPRLGGVLVTAIAAASTYLLLAILTRNLSRDALVAIQQNMVAKMSTADPRHAFWPSGAESNPLRSSAVDFGKVMFVYRLRIASYGGSTLRWLANEGLLATLPSMFMLGILFRLCLKRRPYPGYVIPFFILATFAPVGLCFVAWDTCRFLAMIPFNGLLCLHAMTALGVTPEMGGTRTRHLIAVATLALAANVAIRRPLLNPDRPRHEFPFGSIRGSLEEQAVELGL